MDSDERNIQKFLVVYRITPNLNTDSGLSPAELEFTRKIRSVINRLLPSPMKKVVKENFVTKFYKPRDRVFFRNYRGGKSFWEDGIITKRLGRECKRNSNQLKPRYIKDVIQKDEEELQVIYDAFEILVLLFPPESMKVLPTPPVTEVLPKNY